MDVVNGPKSATVDLVGMAEYTEAVDDQVIIVRVADQTSNDSDIYISYNRVRMKRCMIPHVKTKEVFVVVDTPASVSFLASGSLLYSLSS